MEAITRVKIPIYFDRLYIVISDDFVKSGKSVGIDFRIEVNDYPAIATTKQIKDKATRYVIFIKPKEIETIDLIAHEALHIVNYIFMDRKIKLDPDNDEPQCYLLGWVVKQVSKAIKSFKK